MNGAVSMSLFGRWKELETGNIYIVTTPEDPLLNFMMVVNNPAKNDRREFEIQSGPAGQFQLLPLHLKDVTVTDTLSDCFLDTTVPGRIFWHSYTTGKTQNMAVHVAGVEHHACATHVRS